MQRRRRGLARLRGLARNLRRSRDTAARVRRECLLTAAVLTLRPSRARIKCARVLGRSSDRPVQTGKLPMRAVPKCRVVTVHLFRENRGPFGQSVRKALDDQRHGQGPGPTRVDCLLYAGHTGVSLDREPTAIWGLNPDIGKAPPVAGAAALVKRGCLPGK